MELVLAVACTPLHCADACTGCTSLLLQAFQCSEQAVKLYKDGWFCAETEPSGVSKMKNPKEPSVTEPIIVVSKSPFKVTCVLQLCS